MNCLHHPLGGAVMGTPRNRDPGSSLGMISIPKVTLGSFVRGWEDSGPITAVGMDEGVAVVVWLRGESLVK
jgi:hypothetical protein